MFEKLIVALIVVGISVSPKTILTVTVVGREIQHLGKLNITAYTASVEETDDTPFTTASNQRVRVGICALSRDIEKDFGLKFGDEIVIEGLGKFEFQDRMNKRLKKHVDIFMSSKFEAFQFGRKKLNVSWLKYRRNLR